MGRIANSQSQNESIQNLCELVFYHFLCRPNVTVNSAKHPQSIAPRGPHNREWVADFKHLWLILIAFLAWSPMSLRMRKAPVEKPYLRGPVHGPGMGVKTVYSSKAGKNCILWIREKNCML